ncbi:tRNA-dihydrouridine synthase B [Fusobacterium sp. DD29]|uniref:tRNA dihydrouridine synthase n=1 Tax=unclassified Fusobacterium TaxID=2648384 RepID=UPI001B8AAB13|nr:MULTISPECIES: tRNA-dihydrouridine synthase family protein [unclassified Fusobacterium]MBR8700798.1 tRNA-dihydrouridine synthase B [Fusobacterium sp. DD45]MBR8710577.1 tRNA-dihydrouridine synthase B [Fusobacterium sp. DD28]MBR8749009.1 tRNA-dihydrouridine synthase B [Fusobacterium sp. DD29]MBR8751153.1 tRNA-dihydrouridine synthase B [Fusobacterium sp. DD26]MBR8761216.1 tRNA-dihydrouridine synthase B [Fusobacterium sp. DD25]
MIKIYIAPMAGVTDYTYRGILREFHPDMIFTEMVSINALECAMEKTLNVVLRLREGDSVQLFGKDIPKMVESAKFVEKLGVKHIGINSGCPMKKIVNNGYGAALMENPEHIRAMLSEVRSALNDDTGLSIKIRAGYKEFKDPIKIAKIAEETKCTHITVHGRTREQMYTGKADWSIIKAVKESVNIPVIGNGDIFTAEDAKEKVDYSGVDGIMLARGVFGNPWLIRDIREYFQYGKVITPTTELDRINMAIEHTRRTQIEHPERPFIFELRKHLCWYLKGIRGSAPIKDKINHTDSYEEIIALLNILKESVIEQKGVE